MSEVIIKPLTKNDIKKNTNIILINTIRSVFEINSINKKINDHTLLVIRNFEINWQKSSIINSWIEQDKIRKFSWHVFSVEIRMQSHDICIELIDELSKKITKDHANPYYSLYKIFGSSDVIYPINKVLIKELNNQISTLVYFNELEKESINVFYHPSIEYFISLKLLKKYGYNHIIKKYFSIKTTISNPELNQLIFYYSKKIKYLLVLLAIPIYALLKIRNIEIKQKKKPVQMGLLIYNNDWGLHRGDMSTKVDWFIKDKDFQSNKIVFISENKLDANYHIALENHPLDYYDLSYQNGFSFVSIKFIIKDLFPLIFYKNPLLFIKSIIMDTSYIVLLCEALMTYLLWKSLLYRIVPANTFCYQGTNNKHVFRNIMLSQVGAQNWQYNHSNSSFGIYVDDSIATGRHINWSYLNYDYELHWSMSIKKHFRNNNGKSKHYYSIGPIWSYFIKRNMEFHSKYIENIPETNKIVSIFMTSIGPDAINSYAVHENFLCSIENMLNEKKYSDMTFLFKLKNKLDYIKSTSSEKFFHQLNKILDHKRIIFIDGNVFSGYVIFESELVISEAFCSPGMEALYYGKRSIYLDPLNLYPNSYLTKFPHFVAHNDKQFFNLVDKWLLKDTNDVKDYVKNNIKLDYSNEFEFESIQDLSNMFLK